MQMISRRERFNAAESRIFQATGQHDMPVDPISSNDERGKTHPHMKRDPGFLREHRDWPVFSRNAQHLVENRTNGRRLSLEMGPKLVAATRVRLIPVCEPAVALPTTPHGSAFMRGST